MAGKLNLLNWTPTQLSCLCSSHFEVSCLRKVKNKYWFLKENSIPTILNPSDCDPLYQNIEFEKSMENTLHLNENKSTSNFVTNNISHNVPLINVVITEDAKKENLQSYEEGAVEQCNNSDPFPISMQFDLSSPVSKLRRTVHHDHKYQSSPTIIRRRLFDCEQRLKEKEKKIKLQKRKINRLQKKV